MFRTPVVALALAALSVGACRSRPAARGEAERVASEAGSNGHELRPEFVPLAQRIAQEYRDEYRVTNLSPLMAPFDCRVPSVHPDLSAAQGQGAHAMKLYYLFASDARAFLNLAAEPVAGTEAPEGLSLVKETWHVADGPNQVETNLLLNPDVSATPIVSTTGGPAIPQPGAEIDGKTYHAGAQGELFIMTRLAPGAPGTDKGWVYATVRPDTLEVTAAGALGACMRCHEQAPHDRLFVATQEEARMRLRYLNASESHAMSVQDAAEEGE